MDPEFEKRNNKVIKGMGDSPDLQKITRAWFTTSCEHEYSYHFKWLGLPIIQYPQDIVALQEIIWDYKPDLIIETGIARGGSLILHASILQLLNGDGHVLGIDIDIRKHNRIAIEEHPLSHRITMIEGSSISAEIIDQVQKITSNKSRIMVILDSNHTHDHVYKELELYAPFVSKDQYLIVFDTVVENMPEDAYQDRPWGKGDNPKTAVWEFLKHNDQFVIDKHIEDKLQITVAPDGFLKRVH